MGYPKYEDKLLTVKEAAEYLQVHPNTIRNWDRTGKITAIRYPSEYRRFRIRDLERIRQGGDHA